MKTWIDVLKISRFASFFVGALLWAMASPSLVQALDWNPKTQGDFVFALAQGSDGFWVATENQGVWRRDNAGKWRNFTRADGLGDDSALCLARRGGQIWVGHASGGLSVWDGAAWTNLGVEEGLPSERVTALGVDDNAVWVGTEAGLLRWSDAGGWLIPNSPLCARSIAGVASAGDLVVAATACQGLLISRDGGASWEEVRGPQFQPVTATGAGLPSDVFNDVKIDALGQIWVASDQGFARSSDAGKSWIFLRGADWKENVEGSALGLRPKNTAVDVDLAAEDWVQTLAPTSDGKIWLGFRQKGAELRDCKSGETLFASSDDRAAARLVDGDWVRSIFPLPRDRALTGRYAGGIVGLLGADFPPPLAEAVSPDLTVPGPLPTANAAELEKLAAAQTAPGETAPGETAPPGSGAWESLDFRTAGDWIGRYGDRFALVYDGWGNTYNRALGADFQVRMGPHLPAGAVGPYTYSTEPAPGDRRALYSPPNGERRMGELNDGTWQHSLYPFSWEGPDLWAQATVPAGAHRLSFYFVNNDGRQTDLNRFRDYIVSLRAYTPDIKDAEAAPELARGRLRDASGGGYARFSVVGPAKFWLQIARHRSHVTKVNGLFLDHIAGAPAEAEIEADTALQQPENQPMPWMGGVRYVTETTPPAVGAENEVVSAARRAWSALDENALRVGGLPNRWQNRLAIYRAAKAGGAPETLLANWRWKLTLWRHSDRETFDATMKEAREKELIRQQLAAPKTDTP